MRARTQARIRARTSETTANLVLPYGAVCSSFPLADCFCLRRRGCLSRVGSLTLGLPFAPGPRAQSSVRPDSGSALASRAPARKTQNLPFLAGTPFAFQVMLRRTQMQARPCQCSHRRCSHQISWARAHFRRVLIDRRRLVPQACGVALWLALTLSSAPAAEAAPKADLWPFWTANDPQNQRSIDHGTWTYLLKTYLVTNTPDGINRFKYGGVPEGDVERLRWYLRSQQIIKVRRLRRDEQRAYWINLYNAQTVLTIIEHYPTDSIRDVDISPGLFTQGPWDAPLLSIEGEKVTLNDIEHRILRPIWKDARLHYALNCASLGCPNLMPTAFTAANSEALLEEGARAFINHPRAVMLDADGTLTLSSIYHWFASDFGETLPRVLVHLKKYAAPPLKEKLDAFSRRRYQHVYDWTLNNAPG